MKPLLEVQHVAADIGQFHILQDVSFVVKESAITVLLGRNGAGKTTTMRTLMGYLQPSAGEIIFSGKRLNGMAVHQRKSVGIGYVPEDLNIFPNLTVEENIKLSIAGREGAQSAAGSDARHVSRPARFMEATSWRAQRWAAADAGCSRCASSNARLSADRRT